MGRVFSGQTAQNAGRRALSLSQALIKPLHLPGHLCHILTVPLQRTLLPVGTAITEPLLHQHHLHLEPGGLFYSL